MTYVHAYHADSQRCASSILTSYSSSRSTYPFGPVSSMSPFGYHQTLPLQVLLIHKAKDFVVKLLDQVTLHLLGLFSWHWESADNLAPINLTKILLNMAHNSTLGFAKTTLDTGQVTMQTSHLTSTIWTEITTTIRGVAQWPRVTIYTSLPPVEMASYPDPIMSATGANLQSLLSEERTKASAPSASNPSSEAAAMTTSSSPASASVVESAKATENSSSNMGNSVATTVTYTTEYITDTFVTSYTGSQASKTQSSSRSSPSADTISSSLTSRSSIQVSNNKSSSATPIINSVIPTTTDTPSANTVLPITIDGPITSVPSEPSGRNELPRSIKTSIVEPGAFQDTPHHDSTLSPSQQNTNVPLYIFVIFLLSALLLYVLRTLHDRGEPDDLSYTTKPPQPGLRKRLSLSITVRRPSNASTTSTEAVHVSGNALSIGRNAAKGISIARESEVKRTPSGSLLDV